MISDREIEEKALEFGIKPADVEKDYIYGWVLNALYSQSILADQLILKGGNGLRKAYLPNTRFSKDLDFSCQHSIDQLLLENELKKVCSFVEHKTGVRFSTDKRLLKAKTYQ